MFLYVLLFLLEIPNKVHSLNVHTLYVHIKCLWLGSAWAGPTDVPQTPNWREKAEAISVSISSLTH